MQFTAMIRAFRPRPFKTKGGDQRFSGTLTILDMSDRPIVDTIELERDFPSEDEMKKYAGLVGKTCVVVVENLRVGIDGKARLVGSVEAAK